MKFMVIIILFMLISAIFFNFLFYFLNKKPLEAFKPIQHTFKKVNCLKNKYSKHILHILVIVGISFLAERLSFNSVFFGITLGFLFALIDICFKDNIIENFTEKQKYTQQKDD